MTNIRLKRALALLLTVLLLISALGCDLLGIGGKQPETAQEPVLIAPDGSGVVELPAADTPAPAPAATPGMDESVTASFRALDAEIFRWYVTSDGSTLHALVSNPAVYDIDRSAVAMTLGEFTEADSKRIAQDSAAFLERLHAIMRTGLSQKDQFAYDVIEQYLEGNITGAEYEYYYEPLTEYTGVHADLPLTFALFAINEEQDVIDYLALFADIPRYLGQVLSYEQERAARGMFMTENALDNILDACDEIIDSKDNSFLYATFADAVNALDSLTDAQKQAYIDQNAKLIKNEYIDAYRTLYKGLDALRKKCGKAEGMSAQGERALAYYETRVQSEADNELTVEETLELLQNEFYTLLMESALIAQEHPESLEKEIKITSGDTEADLALCKEITARILPALPEHTLDVSDVPEELQSMFSPAAYVIPEIDEWSKNQILINPIKPDASALLTIAHESYPGHLYQYVYQRGLEDIGMTQKALHYGGYAEGWSQLGEFLIVENQSTYDPYYCKLVFNNNMLFNALLPAIISIYVNYQGYGEQQVKLKLDAYWPTLSKELAKEFYKMAVEQPFYTMRYAVGYSQLMTLLSDAQMTLGDAYDQKAFLTAYLDLGPGYFNLVQERMDVWVDAQMQEAA